MYQKRQVGKTCHAKPTRARLERFIQLSDFHQLEQCRPVAAFLLGADMTSHKQWRTALGTRGEYKETLTRHPSSLFRKVALDVFFHPNSLR